MNCQNCGAENEAEARFCAECGAPLESQVGASQPLEEDDDQTILSMPSQIADEEAKTVAVTQEEVAKAEAEVEAPTPVEPEPDSPPPPDSPAGDNGGDGVEGLFTQRNIIIAIVVLIVLCCCCSALAGAGIALQPEGIDGLISVILPTCLHLV